MVFMVREAKWQAKRPLAIKIYSNIGLNSLFCLTTSPDKMLSSFLCKKLGIRYTDELMCHPGATALWQLAMRIASPEKLSLSPLRPSEIPLDLRLNEYSGMTDGIEHHTSRSHRAAPAKPET